MKPTQILIIYLLTVLFLTGIASAVIGEQWYLMNSSVEWVPRDNYGIATFGGKMWLVGGMDATYAYLNDTWYTDDGDVWYPANLTPEFPARAAPNVITFDNKLWVIGGYWDDGIDLVIPNDVWNSTDGNIWYLANASVLPRRLDYGVIAYNEKLWIMGGYDWDTGLHYNDVWSSSDGIIWTQVTNTANWDPRSALKTIVFDNKMWVVSGSGDNSYFKDAWYSTDGITWTLASTKVAPWYIPTMSVYDAGTKVFAYMFPTGSFSTGIWYTSDMITWTNSNITPQFNTRDYITFGSPKYNLGYTQMTEFNGKLWLINGLVRDPYASQELLDATWYTDNLTHPGPVLPVCSVSDLSTSSVVTFATSGISLIIFGLIIVTGLILIGILNRIGGG